MHVCTPAITVLHVLWMLGLSCRHLAAYMTPARVHPEISVWDGRVYGSFTHHVPCPYLSSLSVTEVLQGV